MNALKVEKNYGLVFEPIADTDYIFGYATPLKPQVLQEDGQWDEYLPVEEFQGFPNFEPSCCATMGSLNALEVLIKRIYKAELNFSDRWLAWNSGTTPQGNDPHRVLETLRKAGVPYEEKWPLREPTSFEEFYKNPPPKLFEDARADFYTKYDLKHQWVPSSREAMKEALKYSPLGISVYAWASRDGIYQQLGQDNHWVLCYGWDEKGWKVFDSYDSSHKIYSFDAQISRVKSYVISNKEPRFWLLELIKRLFT